MPLEILHLPLVLFGGGARLEGAEIATLAGLRIELPRVQPVFAGAQFADHESLLEPPDLPNGRVSDRFPQRLPGGAKTWLPKGCSVGVRITMKLRASVLWQALQPVVRSPKDATKRLPSLASIASPTDCSEVPSVVMLLMGIPE